MHYIIEAANKILNKAFKGQPEFGAYEKYLIGIGERAMDYSLYEIPLKDNYFLLVDFEEFEFNSFSIINRKHLPLKEDES